MKGPILGRKTWHNSHKILVSLQAHIHYFSITVITIIAMLNIAFTYVSGRLYMHILPSHVQPANAKISLTQNVALVEPDLVPIERSLCARLSAVVHVITLSLHILSQAHSQLQKNLKHLYSNSNTNSILYVPYEDRTTQLHELWVKCYKHCV